MSRLLLVVSLLSGTCAPAALAAQETATSPLQVVEDNRLRYGAAREQHQADSSRMEQVRHVWKQLLEQLEAARQSGDADRGDSLRAELQERSSDKTLAENTLVKSREAWIDAGDALISALDAYLQTVFSQIEQPVGSTEDVLAEYNKTKSELETVEGELPQEPLELGPMPEIRIRPGDGPSAIRQKISLLRHWAKAYEGLLLELDSKIDALTERLRLQQGFRDFLGGRDRFGDTSTPTGVDRGSASDAGVSDTTAVKLQLEPIEVRIAKLESFREEVRSELDEIKAKVEDFIRRQGGTA